MSEYSPETIERDLTFVGLEVMQDPPRPEVAAAVEQCRRAGIRVIMITGDYGLTAVSIARRSASCAASTRGCSLAWSSSARATTSSRRPCAARWSLPAWRPRQKLRVVENLQQMGEIVAVTGDGVNDSPALKKADIASRWA